MSEAPEPIPEIPAPEGMLTGWSGFAKLLQARLKKIAQAPIELEDGGPPDRPAESAGWPIAALCETFANLLEIYSLHLKGFEFVELHNLLYWIGSKADLTREERAPRVRALAVGEVFLPGPDDGQRIIDAINALRVRTEALLDFLEDLTPTGCRILVALMS